MLKHLFIAGVLSFAAAGVSQAATIVGATSASASNNFSGYTLDTAIDQSGLNINYTSGVTDFDAYIASNPIHSLSGSDDWFSENGSTSAILTFDLGSVKTIDRIALWNEEFAGFGAGNIFSSLDNLSFSSLVTINPVDNPTQADYGAEVFGLGGNIAMRYMRIDISGCPQPNSGGLQICGMGEIAFSEVAATPPVPVPASGLLLLGVMGAGVMARRKRRA